MNHFLVDEVRRIISICVEQQTRLKSLDETGKRLDKELERLVQIQEENQLRNEINLVLEKIEEIEERISAVNNAKNGFENDYQARIAKISEDNRQKGKSAEYEKTRRLQTEIEAQLYLNLQWVQLQAGLRLTFFSKTGTKIRPTIKWAQRFGWKFRIPTTASGQSTANGGE